jgi:hypothetical protein
VAVTSAELPQATMVIEHLPWFENPVLEYSGTDPTGKVSCSIIDAILGRHGTNESDAP